MATAKFAERQIDNVSTQMKRTKSVLFGVAMVVEEHFLLKQGSVFVHTLKIVTPHVLGTDPSVRYRGFWKGRW